MRKLQMLTGFSILLMACEMDNHQLHTLLAIKKLPQMPIPALVGDIAVPQGFERVACGKHSFGEWLRAMPLRADNLLRLHNGVAKQNQFLHYAILDVPYNRDPLQQCADAVMRLRAEYLYDCKPEPVISFLHQKGKYFTCSSHCQRRELEAFLQTVFSWCGTYNLQAQLRSVKQLSQIQPGDVFIRGGGPGHAMIVMDVVENANSEKLFLLAQSFIPAQEIHLVKNTYHPEMGPWYSCKDSIVQTPGYQFLRSELRTW